MPFLSDMSKNTKLVLFTSNKFNISREYTFIALSKLKVVDCEISLENVFNVYSGNWIVCCTKLILSILDNHV